MNILVKDKDHDSTGKRIKKAVKESGKTQAQVADEADLSKSYLHKIKLGIVDPPIRTVARIGKSVHKRVTDLVKRRNGKNKD